MMERLIFHFFSLFSLYFAIKITKTMQKQSFSLLMMKIKEDVKNSERRIILHSN
jgi:hypothetical protein